MADGLQRARLQIPPTAKLPFCLWSLRILIFILHCAKNYFRNNGGIVNRTTLDRETETEIGETSDFSHLSSLL